MAPAPEAPQYFRTLNILFIGMFVGMVSFFFIAFYLVHFGGFTTNPALHPLLQYTVPVMIGLLYMVASLVHQRALIAARKLGSLAIKKQRYQMATVMYTAILNGAGTFSIVVFLLVGNYLYLVFFAVVLGLFLLRRPTRESFIRDLQLSREEIQQLDQ